MYQRLSIFKTSRETSPKNSRQTSRQTSRWSIRKFVKIGGDRSGFLTLFQRKLFGSFK